MHTERLPITYVTSVNGHNKADVFKTRLPGWEISQREPLFNEDAIHQNAPQNEYRPQRIAEQKAKDDMTMAHAISYIADSIVKDADLYVSGPERLLLYTDTVQLVHVSDTEVAILEKPEGDPQEWARNSPEAMIQSGKDVEIVNALTGVRTGKDGVSEPATVMLRVQFTAKSFTREDIIEYANHADNTIAQTSGGLSVANGARHLYDMNKPLVVSIADSMDDTPTEIMRFDTWDHLTGADLKPFICGAFEPAILRLAEKTKPS